MDKTRNLVHSRGSLSKVSVRIMVNINVKVWVRVRVVQE